MTSSRRWGSFCVNTILFKFHCLNNFMNLNQIYCDNFRMNSVKLLLWNSLILEPWKSTLRWGSFLLLWFNLFHGMLILRPMLIWVSPWFFSLWIDHWNSYHELICWLSSIPCPYPLRNQIFASSLRRKKVSGDFTSIGCFTWFLLLLQPWWSWSL